MTALPFPRPRETVAALLCLASIAIVASAWGFELFGGFIPCRLCLEQRIPYYAGAAVAAVAFLAERFDAPAFVARLGLLILIGLFAWGVSIGVYQAGAEWGYWPGPTDCADLAGNGVPKNALDLFGGIEATRIVDCSKAQLVVFGLSFAGWNVLASLGLIAVAGFGLFVARRSPAA
jgi:disulfide bond formation protein DsbB